MEGLSKGVELLHFDKDPDDPDYYVFELAVDGVLATTFSVGVPIIWDLRAGKGEVALMEYLERQARTLIDRYGDARQPRLDPALLEDKVA